MTLRARIVGPLLGSVLLSGLAACAPQDQAAPTASTNASASGAACAKDQLSLTTAGKFTVGTDKPAYAPWFVDDKPANGKGYESAVAYAVAGKLGFQPADVTWVVVPFTNAYAPGKKSFDVDINQVSITEPRKKAVDFSSGYYDVAQTVTPPRARRSPAPSRWPTSRGPSSEPRWVRPRTPRSPTKFSQPRSRPSTTPTILQCRR